MSKELLQFWYYANGIWAAAGELAEGKQLCAEVRGLSEWYRASAQAEGELVEEFVRVREPERRAKVR